MRVGRCRPRPLSPGHPSAAATNPKRKKQITRPPICCSGNMRAGSCRARPLSPGPPSAAAKNPKSKEQNTRPPMCCSRNMRVGRCRPRPLSRGPPTAAAKNQKKRKHHRTRCTGDRCQAAPFVLQRALNPPPATHSPRPGEY